MAYQQVIRRMPVADNVIDYAVNLCRFHPTDRATAEVNQYLSWGADRAPRSTSSLPQKSTPP